MRTKQLLVHAAVAGLFTTHAVAQSSTPAIPGSSQGARVKCLGINSCKGSGSCKSVSNACKGANACKGQGWHSVSDSECLRKGGKILARD